MKTMLRLASERESLSVVNDQIGTPTNAVDLAEAMVEMITIINKKPDNHNLFGIYNYSNEGFCSWFDFAKKIFEIRIKYPINFPNYCKYKNKTYKHKLFIHIICYF